MPKNNLNKQHYQDFEVYLGTFMNNEFNWHKVAKYKDFTKAYKAFKKYVNKQLQYTEDELKKVWDTGRIDIELRRGSKLLNWIGIYARETEVLGKDKDKSSDEKESKAEDSVDVDDDFRGEIVDTDNADDNRSLQDKILELARALNNNFHESVVSVLTKLKTGEITEEDGLKQLTELNDYKTKIENKDTGKDLGLSICDSEYFGNGELARYASTYGYKCRIASRWEDGTPETAACYLDGKQICLF